MGVAYMNTPFAVSPQTIIWFAKSEYSRTDQSKGRLLGLWTDSLGRCWFEAENDTYHVKGYAMTRGCDAWMVYFGYRLAGRAPQAEIALAAKAPIPLLRCQRTSEGGLTTLKLIPLWSRPA